MKALGHELFACTGLAVDPGRQIGNGHRVDVTPQLLHGGALAQQFTRARQTGALGGARICAFAQRSLNVRSASEASIPASRGPRWRVPEAQSPRRGRGDAKRPASPSPIRRRRAAAGHPCNRYTPSARPYFPSDRHEPAVAAYRGRSLPRIGRRTRRTLPVDRRRAHAPTQLQVMPIRQRGRRCARRTDMALFLSLLAGNAGLVLRGARQQRFTGRCCSYNSSDRGTKSARERQLVRIPWRLAPLSSISL